MRINKFLALATGMSRRAADKAIDSNLVRVNQKPTKPGYLVRPDDSVTLKGRVVSIKQTPRQTILLNKPVGYVCSRRGQGSKTIYSLLPGKFHQLKPAGRLDKDSSGLVVLSDDGALLQRLTHPRYGKLKLYQIKLDKPLQPDHQQTIQTRGVKLEDGVSKFEIKQTGRDKLVAELREGRNRQIRRTFAALGYQVVDLHRTRLGDYDIGSQKNGEYKILD